MFFFVFFQKSKLFMNKDDGDDVTNNVDEKIQSYDEVDLKASQKLDD